MNLLQIARLLGYFTLFFTAWGLIPLVHHLALGEPVAEVDTAVLADTALVDARTGFLWLIAAGLFAGGTLGLIGRRAEGEIFRREALAVVAAAWLLAGLLGALPLWAAGAIPGYDDAFFEAISGLTTTGATVLGTADNPSIESLHPSVLLWRSMLQWIGGAGVVLVFSVLFSAFKVGSHSLLDSEAVGVDREDEKPRMKEQSRHLLRLYTTLTLLAMVGYWATGMSFYDAINHAMTTMATGGFSTRNQSVGAYQNLGTELVSIVFMFLAGVNFVLMLSAVRGRRLNVLRLWRNAEFRIYLGLSLVLIVAVTGTLWLWGVDMPDRALGNSRDYSDPLQCLRDAAFQVVSMLTSTGYGTCDFQNWPKPTLYVLILCMFFGGSTGSTAGGLKVFRVLTCSKLVSHSLRLFIRPRTVHKLRIGDEVVRDSTISSILTLLLLWILFVALGTLILVLDQRLDPVSAFTASVSCMGCTGPAITDVLLDGDQFRVAATAGIDLGPYGGYGDLHGYAKIYLTFQMILGRLEILAPLVVLYPSFWRK